MPRLFVLSGDDLGRTHDFDAAIVLGRGTEADFRVREASVSRRHARLEPHGAGWRVVDLGSSNGLRVDGERVQEAPLEDGDVFVLGDLELRFREDAPSAGSAPSAAAAPAPRAEPAPTPRAEPAPAPRAEPAPAGDVENTTFLPAPTSAPPTPAAPSAGARDDEIELEGEWDDAAAAAQAAAPEAPRQAAPHLPASGRAASGTPASTRPAAHDAARQRRRAAALGGATAPGASGDPARQVLQYSRVEGAGGLLGADLAQRPTWVRALVYLVAFGVLVGGAWGALELTRSLRENSARMSAPADE